MKGSYKDGDGRDLDDVKVSNHILPDGSRYEGCWRGGGINGFGKGCYDDGDVYEGEYRDGEKDGLGCLTYADRSQHVGMRSSRW